MKKTIDNIIWNAALSPIFFAEGVLSSYIISHHVINNTGINPEYLQAMGVLGGVGLLAAGVTTALACDSYKRYKENVK